MQVFGGWTAGSPWGWICIRGALRMGDGMILCEAPPSTRDLGFPTLSSLTVRFRPFTLCLACE